jgi:hypothetical protein
MTAGERIRGWREGRGIFKITRLEQRVRDARLSRRGRNDRSFGARCCEATARTSF